MNSETEQLEWVDKLATRIKDRGVSSLALLLIEIVRPFGFLGSQALLVTQPLLTGIVNDLTVEQATVLLDNPDLLNQLSTTLEEAETE